MAEPSQHDPTIIVALDYANREDCNRLVKQLDPTLCRLKIGKEMFTLFGPPIIEELQGWGFEVFLDLKFHDIPTTVGKAVSAAASLGVWMVNVHASGGSRMMVAARNVLERFNHPPLLIGVTVLTSMDVPDLEGIGVNDTPENQVGRLALLAKNAALDGVVCSAQEATLIKQQCGENFLCITPGIRPAGTDVTDQRRVMTPELALANGSDYLVIGRPITQADDPLKSLENIAESIKHCKKGER